MTNLSIIIVFSIAAVVGIIAVSLIDFVIIIRIVIVVREMFAVAAAVAAGAAVGAGAGMVAVAVRVAAAVEFAVGLGRVCGFRLNPRKWWSRWDVYLIGFKSDVGLACYRAGKGIFNPNLLVTLGHGCGGSEGTRIEIYPSTPVARVF